MTREEAINEYIIPAIKSKWNDKVCDEIIKALIVRNDCRSCVHKDMIFCNHPDRKKCVDYSLYEPKQS